MEIKDVHNAIRDVKIQGGHEGDIEAFLINTEDFYELQEADKFGGAFLRTTDAKDGEYSEARLLGVKIITSNHMPRGTVFKIMKNDQKQYAHPIDEMGNIVVPIQQYSPTVPVSGIVSNGFTNFGATAGEACEAVKELAKAISIPSHLLNDEVDEEAEVSEAEPEEDKVVENRHSKTRKIKLD